VSKSKWVTTPKLPPPPRKAQNRSGSSSADATWSEPSGGFFTWLTLPEHVDTTELREEATAAGEHETQAPAEGPARTALARNGGIILTRNSGEVLIRDLGSTNGIRINGQRVEQGA